MYRVCVHAHLDGMCLCSRETLFVLYLISKKYWQVPTLPSLGISHIY
uniref:Uncharacterized protein n=1 Tax=Triticum urartu TaxID=4572 RepID=A0A8R7PU42_TRIUA